MSSLETGVYDLFYAYYKNILDQSRYHAYEVRSEEVKEIRSSSMGSEERLNFYEELRMKNVQRNEECLRVLGLCLPRFEDQLVERAVQRRRRSTATLKKASVEPRRSLRIAELEKSSSNSLKIREARSTPARTVPTVCQSDRRSPVISDVAGPLELEDDVKEVQKDEKEMDDNKSSEHGYSTDGSSDNFYEVHVDMDAEGKQSMTETGARIRYPVLERPVPTNVLSLDSLTPQSMSTIGTQFQEFVLKALMQSTAALIGPPALFSAVQGASSGSPVVCTQGVPPGSTWNEAAFNRAKGHRWSKPVMQRTSAGENSDSQVDDHIPENETPQQKSLRARRLNRSRARRAKDLTNNRKALKKLPYVIHVDGTGKAKGIHRHQWRAAVRGQCGRLDPSLDNINHHPRHVVDSIWHALEKEWEFEGFTHRAREMFEKSATKFMRNRKMQLKYKWQKTVDVKHEDGKKPDDVSSSHWTKIVDIAKKSAKEATSMASTQSTPKGKEKVATHVQEDGNPTLHLMWSGSRSPQDSSEIRNTGDAIFLKEDDVEAKIRSLQKELVRLQNSRKEICCVQEPECGRSSIALGDQIIMSHSSQVCEGMKENVKPQNGNEEVPVKSTTGMSLKTTESQCQEKMLFGGVSKRKASVLSVMTEFEKEESGIQSNETQMECGDVVRLFAMTDGIEKEIAKGIIMGLAGSKFARKIIPRGWRTVKVSSYTCYAASASCPFPAGWTEPMKHQSVKEACGRTILWPDSLVHGLLQD